MELQPQFGISEREDLQGPIQPKPFCDCTTPKYSNSALEKLMIKAFLGIIATMDSPSENQINFCFLLFYSRSLIIFLHVCASILVEHVWSLISSGLQTRSRFFPGIPAQLEQSFKASKLAVSSQTLCSLWSLNSSSCILLNKSISRI